MDKYGLPAVYNTLMSGIGEELGTGEVRYIQDVGQKVEGTPYLDKNTNKLYLCVQTTNSVNNDSSFMRFDMKEAFAKLQNLSQNLSLIMTIGGTGQVSIKTSGNVMVIEIDSYSSGCEATVLTIPQSLLKSRLAQRSRAMIIRTSAPVGTDFMAEVKGDKITIPALPIYHIATLVTILY